MNTMINSHSSQAHPHNFHIVNEFKSNGEIETTVSVDLNRMEVSSSKSSICLKENLFHTIKEIVPEFKKKALSDIVIADNSRTLEPSITFTSHQASTLDNKLPNLLKRKKTNKPNKTIASSTRTVDLKSYTIARIDTKLPQSTIRSSKNKSSDHPYSSIKKKIDISDLKIIRKLVRLKTNNIEMRSATSHLKEKAIKQTNNINGLIKKLFETKKKDGDIYEQLRSEVDHLYNTLSEDRFNRNISFIKKNVKHDAKVAIKEGDQALAQYRSIKTLTQMLNGNASSREIDTATNTLIQQSKSPLKIRNNLLWPTKTSCKKLIKASKDLTLYLDTLQKTEEKITHFKDNPGLFDSNCDGVPIFRNLVTLKKLLASTEKSGVKHEKCVKNNLQELHKELKRLYEGFNNSETSSPKIYDNINQCFGKNSGKSSGYNLWNNSMIDRKSDRCGLEIQKKSERIMFHQERGDYKSFVIDIKKYQESERKIAFLHLTFEKNRGRQVIRTSIDLRKFEKIGVSNKNVQLRISVNEESSSLSDIIKIEVGQIREKAIYSKKPIKFLKRLINSTENKRLFYIKSHPQTFDHKGVIRRKININSAKGDAKWNIDNKIVAGRSSTVDPENFWSASTYLPMRKGDKHPRTLNIRHHAGTLKNQETGLELIENLKNNQGYRSIASLLPAFSIDFSNKRCRYDEEFSKSHGMPDFEAAATASNDNKIVVYNTEDQLSRRNGLNKVYDTINHEMGHLLANFIYNDMSPPDKSEYAAAAKERNKHLSDYGNTNLAEDFAESVSYYFHSSKKIQENFRKQNPNRWAAIKNILDKKGDYAK